MMEQGKTRKLSGTIRKTFMEKPTFSAGFFDTEQEGEVKFAARAFLREGDRICATGKFGTHPKFGSQFQIDSFTYDVELDEEGLIAFISKSGAFEGIGPSRARKLVSETRGRFEEALQEDLGRLSALTRIPLGPLQTLKDEWFARRDSNRTMTALASWGVTPGSAQTLIGHYGPGVIGIVEENPFWLIGRVKGFGFKRVDEIALAASWAKSCPHRMRAGLAYLLVDLEREGHSWVDHEDLVDDAERLLALDDVDPRSRVCEAIKGALAEERPILTKLVDQDTGIPSYFPSSVYAAELYVMRAMAEKAAIPGAAHDATAAEIVAFESSLNPGQAEAVATALRNRISVITGGAGVGKTYTIDTLCRICEESGLAVGLAAPTGKAARRISESTGREASTIHRMLEVDHGKAGDGTWGFKRNEDDPLPYDVVVIDEVSMVDARLMAALLKACCLPDTTVVLVGDQEQLPSIQAGCILRDAIAFGLCPVARLTEVHRQAGELKKNTSLILEGKVADTSKDPGGEEGAKTLRPWYRVSNLAEPENVLARLHKMMTGSLAECSFARDSMGDSIPIDPVWHCQVLTPMHKGPIGTIALNTMIQRIYQASLGHEEPAEVRAGQKPRPQEGDKVIWTRNDYDLGIFNGTIGVIRERVKGGGFLVDFEGAEYSIPSEKADRLDLAYALTIHKVQGSEFPVAIIVAHKAHSRMHHRGLLYTGVSRASRTAILLGDGYGISNCARKVETDKRRTLPRLLAAWGKPGDWSFAEERRGEPSPSVN